MTTRADTTDASMQAQIIQAARQLFQLHGLEKVTMDDVAREIGKGRSSLYYYYKSKEEILDAAIDAEMQEILAEIAQAIEKAVSFEQKLNAYYLTRLKISRKRRMFYDNIESNIMEAGQLSDYLQLRAVRHEKFRKLEIPLLRQLLQTAVQDTWLRKMSPAEEDALVFLLLSNAQGFKKEMLRNKNFKPIEQGIAMLTTLILQGFKP